jgi:aspartate carbamoyltransferase catalytic subunit
MQQQEDTRRETVGKVVTVRSLVEEIGFEGQNLHSINDLTNDQVYGLFELARLLEPFNRSATDLLRGNVMVTLFFQPSTRTRMSFETAMHRLGGAVVTEANPMVSSSAAKEESLADMMRTVSKYANVIVLRHPNDEEAREGAKYAESPVINGGWGDWEHPTQALLDLYTLWRTQGKVEGAKVMDNIKGVNGTSVREVFNLDQDEFNDLIREVDLVYLPGSSAPKGAEAEEFKKMMDDFFVRHETLEEVRKETGRTIRVTHTLPRRAGEMDLSIDNTPHQQYFEAIAYSVAIRMALVSAILGVK